MYPVDNNPYWGAFFDRVKFSPGFTQTWLSSRHALAKAKQRMVSINDCTYWLDVSETFLWTFWLRNDAWAVR